jgi:UDP-GlcNAc:undecaprenyl-phosphate GlcNAc-1-phosphate transferase
VTTAVAVPAIVAVVAAGAAALATPAVRRLALRLGVTDKPSPRKAHAAPVPYLGGLAIAAGIAAGVLAGWSWSWAATAVVAGALLLVVVGVTDDVRTLAPSTRLVAEGCAAGLALGAGLRFPLGPPVLALALAVLWVVLLANSVNLLDNMDGAAASSTAAAAAVLGVAAWMADRPLPAVLATATAGACLGFLRWNWGPARIFMGDGGSLLLGYLLAVCSLGVVAGLEPLRAAAAVFLFAALPLFDTTLVVISRWRAGRSFFQGGTDHTSHRLHRLGLSVRATSTALALAAGGAAAAGLGVAQGWLPAVPVLSAAAAAGPVLLALALRVPGYPGPVRAPERAV